MMIYPTRYQAEKQKSGDERVIKVTGGYILMKARDYEIWRRQK